MIKGLVSIVTPTYNCGKFIAETMESVQAQTYTNWEMIIVDDCSTDDTKAIVTVFMEKDSRIKYYCLDENSGAAVARTKAMELALEGKFNVLVTLKNGKLDSVPLEDVVGNNKEIGARSGGTESTNIKRVTMDDDLVKVARNLDICLGD
jgi:glycosyltransferase involved in cell wall biosynthesis